MPEITRANACDHRLPLLRVDKCDMCGGKYPKGTPFEVYGCAIHGECSFEKRRRTTQSCGACIDRESVEFGVERIFEESKPARVPTKPRPNPATCEHRTPIAHVAFDRTSTPWTATVVVKCAGCGLPFFADSGPKVSFEVTPPGQSSPASSGLSSR